MTLRRASNNPRMIVLASLLMACGGKGMGTDAGDRRDGGSRDVADARARETAWPDSAVATKDAGLDRFAPLSPDVRADEAGAPDTAVPAKDAEVDRSRPADALIHVDTRPEFDTRPVDAAVPDARETGAEALLPPPDAPADTTRPIDQAGSPEVPYGLDAHLVDAGSDANVHLADALPGACTERPGVSCRVCNPVAPGAPVSFDVTDDIRRLIADPSACLVYGFVRGDPSRIVVFDAAQKSVLTRVDLGAEEVSVSLSPSGTFLVASLYEKTAIAVVDKATWTISLMSTAMRPIDVAVDDRGVVYYTSLESPSLRRIDLTLGLSGDTAISSVGTFNTNIALSPDGTRLYWADRTTFDIYALDVTSATPTVTSQLSASDSSSSGLLYVGPSGKHIYYGIHQFDASNLALVKGSVYGAHAEDSQARFVAASYGIFDAQTLTALVSKPNNIQAATFISADSELWTYSRSEAKITCANVADLTVGKTLGLREGEASAIGEYEFSKLVADPVRPRLYGLDALREQVVSIDRATGTAMRTVLVGSTPTDLEIDPSGAFIYTGHLDTYAIAQIDAASFSFVKFIASPRASFEIAPLGSSRIASLDSDVWTMPALMDVASGSLLDTLPRPTMIMQGVLFGTADGNAVFTGGTRVTRSPITRYDVSAGKFVAGTTGDSGDSVPARRLVGTPDGTSIYYGGYCLDGTNLQTKRYAQTDMILSVTSNGKLAISETKVYRVSDGTELATLPSACPVQAVSPDSSTVHCAGTSGISSFSLPGLP